MAARGNWNTKLGFVLAAAGSAVGLGNIWAFPTNVAQNGGAAFVVIYILCCFLVGYPLMVAELLIGRRTGKNPVGAFRALSRNPLAPLIGFWGVLCGVMILTFYVVLAGLTAAYIFEEICYFAGYSDLANFFAATGDGGHKNAVFSIFFMAMTILIVVGGVSGGIERATKTLMPMLIVILVLMIVYVVFQPGSGDGLREYLRPDFSRVDTNLVLSAMGQAFFSLSLGMGALITYGSYLRRDQNIAGAAAYVTVADFSIAFLAGLLIIPAMYVAQAQGIEIFDGGTLKSSTTLVFDVLPNLFHSLGGLFGFLGGVLFFLLLSIAALTSTISLLEVPVSYLIDEHSVSRRKAALAIGSVAALFSLVVAYDLSWVDTLFNIFGTIGLPLGGLMICLFLGWVWKTEQALAELEEGAPGIRNSVLGRSWAVFVRYICPVLILIVFVTSVRPLIGLWVW